MGAFCEWLHLTPAQVRELPVVEFDALAAYVVKRMKEVANA